jgi:8-oxo-dGTP pyrophosphatase MutT (NUDIX family)
MVPRASAGGVILGPENKLLLVNQHNNSWSFPKGGVEAGETTLDAAKREVYEEAGITELEFLAELGSYERYSLGKDGTTEDVSYGLRTRTFFLFRTEQSPKPDNVETTDVRWVSIDEAVALLTHPKDREFLESVRSTIEAVALK